MASVWVADFVPEDGTSNTAYPRRPVRVINGEALATLVKTEDAIEIVDSAMRAISAGEVDAPQRFLVPVSETGKLAYMPGTTPALGCFGLKVISLNRNAASSGLPSHQGAMLLFDLNGGYPLAFLDCHALTRIRTSAASAVATRALSRPDSRTLAIVGCGDLSEIHVDAISSVRKLERLFLCARSLPKAQAVAQRCGARFPDLAIECTTSVRDAVRDADIICTLTNSRAPVLEGAWLRPGQHVNLVGASIASDREVDDLAVQRARFIADSSANVLAQGGEFRHAMETAGVNSTHLLGEIGAVLDGRVAGRISPSDITMYKSLGHTAQDLFVSAFALKKADVVNLGTTVEW